MTYQTLFELAGIALFISWLFTQNDLLYYSMWLLMIVYLLYKISIKPVVNVYVDKECTKIEVINETENNNS